MLSVSNLFIDSTNQDDIYSTFKVYVSKKKSGTTLVVLDINDFVEDSLELTKQSSSSGSFAIGGVCMSEFRMTLNRKGVDKLKAAGAFRKKYCLKVVQWNKVADTAQSDDDFSVNRDGSVNTTGRCVLGYYYIGVIKNSDYQCELTAYSSIIMLDKNVSAKFLKKLKTEKHTISEWGSLIAAACSKSYYDDISIVVDSSCTNKSLVCNISDDSSVTTYREVLSYLATLAGGFATEKANGDIVIRAYHFGTSVETTVTDRLNEYEFDSYISEVQEVNSSVAGFDFSAELSSKSTTANEVELDFDENIFLRGIEPYDAESLSTETQTALSNISNKFLGLHYHGGTVTFATKPYFELGDLIQITRVIANENGVLTNATVDDFIITKIVNKLMSETRLTSPQFSGRGIKISSSPKNKPDVEAEDKRVDTLIEQTTGTKTVKDTVDCISSYDRDKLSYFREPALLNAYTPSEPGRDCYFNTMCVLPDAPAIIGIKVQDFYKEGATYEIDFGDITVPFFILNIGSDNDSIIENYGVSGSTYTIETPSDIYTYDSQCGIFVSDYTKSSRGTSFEQDTSILFSANRYVYSGGKYVSTGVVELSYIPNMVLETNLWGYPKHESAPGVPLFRPISSTSIIGDDYWGGIVISIANTFRTIHNATGEVHTTSSIETIQPKFTYPSSVVARGGGYSPLVVNDLSKSVFSGGISIYNTNINPNITIYDSNGNKLRGFSEAFALSYPYQNDLRLSWVSTHPDDVVGIRIDPNREPHVFETDVVNKLIEKYCTNIHYKVRRTYKVEYSKTIEGVSEKVNDTAEGVETNAEDISKLNTSISKLNNQISSISSTVSGFNDRLNNVEDGLGTAESQLSTHTTNISNLDRRVTALEQGGGGGGQELEELKRRVSTAETDISTNTTNISNNTTNISNLDTRVAALEQGGGGSEQTQINALKERVSAIETHDTEQDTSLATLDTGLTNLDTRVTALEQGGGGGGNISNYMLVLGSETDLNLSGSFSYPAITGYVTIKPNVDSICNCTLVVNTQSLGTLVAELYVDGVKVSLSARYTMYNNGYSTISFSLPLQRYAVETEHTIKLILSSEDISIKCLAGEYQLIVISPNVSGGSSPKPPVPPVPPEPEPGDLIVGDLVALKPLIESVNVILS